jgi:hypothetical protein
LGQPETQEVGITRAGWLYGSGGKDGSHFVFYLLALEVHQFQQ